MNNSREQWKAHLLRFLESIQRAGASVESLAEHEPLVASGLIDSLALLQIITYLEKTYAIDFSMGGVDPEQLGSVANILDLIGRKETEPGRAGT